VEEVVVLQDKTIVTLEEEEEVEVTSLVEELLFIKTKTMDSPLVEEGVVVILRQVVLVDILLYLV
jgi:hypothetical protein